jgi:hypothetical protein
MLTRKDIFLFIESSKLESAMTWGTAFECILLDFTVKKVTSR